MTMSLLAAALAAFTVAASPALTAPLGGEQWRKRIVLIFSPPANELASRQRSTLMQDRSALLDRDLLVLEISGDLVKTVFGTATDVPAPQVLRQRYSVQADAFMVVLVGKDGGEKLRRTEPIAVTELFGVIDSMPMRQSEMSRAKPE